MSRLFHYTNVDGFNGIRATPIWHFRASKPPTDHPVGAYFTTYDESTPLLAQKLRIPRSKIEYVFIFSDNGDLKPISGGRGKHIFYSPSDYFVDEPRQIAKKRREDT